MRIVRDIDEQLARLLLLDGRASFSDLAKQLGMSRSVVASRVTALTNSGRLRIVAVVHPLVLGLKAVAHVSIALNGSAARVIDDLTARDNSVFVSLTTGEYAVTAEMRLATMGALQAEIEQIRAIPEVRAVDVLLYEDIPRSFFLSEEPDIQSLVLDDVDLFLMSELQKDGRLSFGELGNRVGLSVSAARSRIVRLLEANFMRIGVIRSRDPASPSIALGLGVRTAGNAEAVIAYLGQQQGIEFIARCFGRFDVVATIAAESPAAAAAVVEDVRSLADVASVASWAHLRIVKETYEKSLDNLTVKSRHGNVL